MLTTPRWWFRSWENRMMLGQQSAAERQTPVRTIRSTACSKTGFLIVHCRWVQSEHQNPAETEPILSADRDSLVLWSFICSVQTAHITALLLWPSSLLPRPTTVCTAVSMSVWRLHLNYHQTQWCLDGRCFCLFVWFTVGGGHATFSEQREQLGPAALSRMQVVH